MKFLSSLFALALCFTACAQFTSEPPGKHGQVFTWTTQPPGRVLDSDARSFIRRANLTDRTEVSAVGNLVRDLKKAGVWRKLTAFYPFVGGTEASCSENLRSAKYPVAWQGTVTFSAAGVTGDGEGAIGDTGYAPSMAATPSSFHMYVWVCQNASGGTGAVMGTGVNSTPPSLSYLMFTGGGFFSTYGPNGEGGLSSNFGQGGNFLWQRTNSSTVVVWNDANQASRTTAVTPATSNTIKILGAPEVNGLTSPGTIRAASFGSALTVEESAAYFAAVNRFETALGRGDPAL